MNRRQFIKNFDPNSRIGNSVYLEGPLSEEQRLRVLSVLEENMKNIIPPEYWSKVKYIDSDYRSDGMYDPVDDLEHSMAWKYSP